MSHVPCWPAVALAALLGPSLAAAQEAVHPEVATQQAEQLIASGDVTGAVPLLERAGRNWYPDADLRLGLLYLDGEGIDRDVDRAVRHLQRAAEPNWMRMLHKRGHPHAQHALAGVYLSREIGPFDPKAGVRLHEAAARSGHEASQLALARLYASGEGTDVDRAEAFRWAAIARRAGDDAIRSEAGDLARSLRASLDPADARRIEREAAAFESRS
jgi:TPR repeat protein